MRKWFTGNQLKFIALFFMLIDHVGAILLEPAVRHFPQNEWLFYLYVAARLIGRLAFPLYGLLIAEGIHHTSNLSRYAARLFLFAIISEIPFDFAVYGKILCIEDQNIYFTLCLSVLPFAGKERWQTIFLLFISCFVATIIRCDYGVVGPVMIFFMVLGRENLGKYLTAFLVIGYGVLALVPLFEGILLTVFLAGVWNFFVSHYNGIRGREVIKRFFYWFYPAHLLVLWLIQSAWNQTA